MVDDLADKGKVCFIAYYIRDPGNLSDVLMPTGMTHYGCHMTPWATHDYSSFEKYVVDRVTHLPPFEN